MKKKNPHTFFERIRIFFFPITERKRFDSVVGVISLLNPIALLPQLYNCIILPEITGVSAAMYVLFALLQSAFGLVAIKAKNLWMFLSMFISILISISIIILTLIKGWLYHSFFINKNL